ncbi:uncharacterized protein YpiB (UPF0302 family) [Staphylococcus auricularis]|uniref:IDEAL domain-containing protein n=1 Tax=Staphylococcus auricularis TaxID=29379 RepID=A0AAP8TTQ4_9STAP|nr:IDEAL domain-containing protein [Staphylococcus auricularis]MBM0868832.1 IDEAL domain-containing protein [Staphylococcus auricularis]MCG7341453.1 IDEAL domain-containing protein [Staphylococcus auricularis]MDC6326334.1 IDEAL domain-containing protein [Staphylococcus auricularis]MDN4533777.1 IDEAL domain-containing protein [Staphylococcus auricularis]PNZ68670.1 IDEAL domain-containing protein [Staphylococcus auricularis]
MEHYTYAHSNQLEQMIKEVNEIGVGYIIEEALRNVRKKELEAYIDEALKNKNSEDFNRYVTEYHQLEDRLDD